MEGGALRHAAFRPKSESSARCQSEQAGAWLRYFSRSAFSPTRSMGLRI